MIRYLGSAVGVASTAVWKPMEKMKPWLFLTILELEHQYPHYPPVEDSTLRQRRAPRARPVHRVRRVHQVCRRRPAL